MPLLFSKNISERSAYAVWNIKESNEELVQLLKEPSPEGHPVKSAEWMVGRILVETLCSKFGLKYQGIGRVVFSQIFVKNKNGFLQAGPGSGMISF